MTYLTDKHVDSAAGIRLLMRICVILAAVTSGCSFIDQVDYETEYTAISLGPNDLENSGIGFLTPSAATGREADKQALAMSFSKKLQEMRPDSDVAGVRYFAQMSLSSFTQYSLGRFSFLGMRISHTEVANLRVFVQIWDARNADVAWEGFTELNYAYETGAEKPVTFADVSQMAAERMFTELPKVAEK
jgi:hypothetical protein